MDIAVLALGRPAALPEILGNHFPWRDSPHEKCAHVPMEGRDYIIALQRGRVADRDSLHAVAGVHTAHDPPLAVEGGDAVFKRPCETQVVIHLQEIGPLDAVGSLLSFFHTTSARKPPACPSMKPAACPSYRAHSVPVPTAASPDRRCSRTEIVPLVRSPAEIARCPAAQIPACPRRRPHDL